MKKEELCTINIKFLVQTPDNKIVVPSEDGYVKRFTFNMPLEDLRSYRDEDIKHFKDILFSALLDNFYFYDFIADIGLYSVLIFAIDFTLDDKEYDFPYATEDYEDSWLCDIKLIIDEDYARCASYGYEFDEYRNFFGMDKKNYNYVL
jgi:hypothetical protein